MTTTENGTHPIIIRVRQAADDIRLANHATYGNRCEVIDLYELLGSLTELLQRLPQLIAYLRDVLDDADSQFYEHDRGDSSDDTLNLADFCLIDALSSLALAHGALSQAWTEIGHLRPRDIDSDSE
ncbi:MAG: hypothetical protein GEV09_08345 [Pseudonocardiaceae bacterium]|nr:hypothetical protein [Pseudonocardiaceae bacterium]